MLVLVFAVHKFHIGQKVHFNGAPVTLHVPVFDALEQILVGNYFALFQ
jgi:hypothetical protein